MAINLRAGTMQGFFVALILCGALTGCVSVSFEDGSNAEVEPDYLPYERVARTTSVRLKQTLPGWQYYEGHFSGEFARKLERHEIVLVGFSRNSKKYPVSEIRDVHEATWSKRPDGRLITPSGGSVEIDYERSVVVVNLEVAGQPWAANGEYSITSRYGNCCGSCCNQQSTSSPAPR